MDREIKGMAAYRGVDLKLFCSVQGGVHNHFTKSKHHLSRSEIQDSLLWLVEKSLRGSLQARLTMRGKG